MRCRSDGSARPTTSRSAYLAALENPYMTGDVVTVDGGLRLL